ncbi:uncharacterized protein LOC128671245 isoform X2 [Plodia interpunctella]|uniref:uncharacterized protein LOC128671245 isoform X2 n=1 Tax=Plodia interpunctella TaxID=58824 RepID=UPI002368987F|nr:uncharacterized protein LOC128671245 isoform X2 [Plodia interpunctella]
MLVSDLNFQKQFFISMIPLKLNGSHPNIPRNRFWVGKTFVLMINLAIIMWLLFNAVFNHDIPDRNYSDMCGNSIMLLIGTNTIIKFWFLHYNRKYMAELFQFVENDYELSKYLSEEEKEIVIKHVKISITVTKHSLFSFFNGFIFFIRAVSLMSYYTWKGQFRLVHMYDIALPGQYNERRNDPMVYFFCLYCATFFGVYASTMNTAFEPLVPITLLHIKGQVQICSNRMKELFTKNKNPEEVYREIKWVNLKLQKLYNVLEGLNTKFGPLYEFTLKVNTGLFPLISFRVVQSEQLREAIYSCNWENHTDKKVRTSIIIMLARTQKAMHFMSIFHPICRDTFSLVCRQSYTIFNVIYAAWM